MTSDEKLAIASAYDVGYQLGYDDGKHDGASDERKRIVEWLREQDGHGYDDMRANLIEAGEHRRHNPNCAVVRNGNLRAWCDCGKGDDV